MRIADRLARSRLLPNELRGFFGLPGSRPWRVILCLFLASTAEGIGLASLLPVLAIVTGEGEPSGLAATILEVTAWLGLPTSFTSLLVFVVAALVCKAALMILAYRVIAATAAAVTAELRRNLLAALLAVRWPYYVRQPVGRIANAMGVEAVRCGDGYVVAANVFVFTIQSLAYLSLAFLISWRLALLAIATGGVILLLLSGFVRRARRSSRKNTRHSSGMSALLADTLQGIKAIRAMAREATFFGLIAHHIDRTRRALFRQAADRETLSSLQEGTLALLFGLGLWVAHERLGLGGAELVVSTLLLLRAVATITKVQKAWQAASQFRASIDHLESLIAEARALAEPTGGLPPPPLAREIRLERVSFAWPQAAPVLVDVDLVLPAGRIIVLTGPSGVGKTTLVDLILALLEPESGRILIDDVPLAAIDRQAWRRQIGYVPQEPVLLHATVRENLTLGDRTVDAAAIERALRLAEAFELVAQLPQGLETVVGERGSALSGGQRQRLALARALVHRPRLLILDEVTSALDAESERRICENLAGMPDRPTILAITHRPAWLRVADHVVEMDSGRLRLRSPTAIAADPSMPATSAAAGAGALEQDDGAVTAPLG